MYVLSLYIQATRAWLAASNSLASNLGRTGRNCFTTIHTRGAAWHCSGTEWTPLLQRARRPQVSPMHICPLSRATWREGTGALTRPSCLLVVLDSESELESQRCPPHPLTRGTRRHRHSVFGHFPVHLPQNRGSSELLASELLEWP